MQLIARIAAGRRTKWVVVALWLVLAVIFAPLQAKLRDVTSDDPLAFLPSDSEAAQAHDILTERFPGAPEAVLMVYRRSGGLTAADQERIAADARRATEFELTDDVIPPFGPESQPGLVSEDGEAAFTVLPVDSEDQQEITELVEDLRELTDETPPGLEGHVTGPPALRSDLNKAFESADAPLLIATGLLVLSLLIVIYRSPAIALVPLFVVGISYAIAAGIIYLLADSGLQVSSTSTSLLLVLMFGAGTDYCLLMVARYVEDLRRTEDKHEAMYKAVPRAAPAILASGGTVALALLVLLVAQLGSTRTLGPVAAIGIAVVLAASVTLLPALLAIVGRPAFWPSRKQVSYKPDLPPTPELLPGLRPLTVSRIAARDQHPAVREREGIWRRLGVRVLEHPVPALAAVSALLLIGAIGLTVYKPNTDLLGSFRDDPDSTVGYDLLASEFPPGILAPTKVLVQREQGVVTPEDVAATQRKIGEVPDSGLARPPGPPSEDGQAVAFDLILPDDPYENPALDRIPELRSAVGELGPDLEVLIGGITAQHFDEREASDSDFRLIVPLVLLVILITLIALLRAVVAPLYLIGSVLLSFLGILGMCLVFFNVVLGEESFNPAFPTFAFVFLVALGVDYNIFLMDRVREEAVEHGTKEGMLRGLIATGPVITSAGMILAGTFAVLATLPITVLLEIGFVVAVGVLVDTFLVRTLMVPAIVALVGDRSWWPSRLARREGPPPPPR